MSNDNPHWDKGSWESTSGTTWKEIQEAVQGLRFGSVEITVHDGRVVQIERKEKIRLDKPENRE